MKGNVLRVLLIEDDEDDYILTRALLSEVKGTEYEINWVSKYSDALEAICKADHDVCLIDFRLGEGTGIELIREASRLGADAPMILLTGQGDREIDFDAAEAGAADYLVKGEIEAALLDRSIRYSVKNAQMHSDLRASERRFRSVIESAGDAIVLTCGDGRILSWNKSAKSIFGYREEEIIGKPFASLFPPTLCGAENNIEKLLAAGLLRLEGRSREMSGVRVDGEEFPLEIALSSWQAAAGETFYCGIIRDITERKHLEDQLTHQALHDALTRLPNRILFHNRLEHALARSDRHHIPLGILFLDLDNFKNINDSMGHAAGDQILVSIAERLTACLRVGDTAARLGGDEFAVLVEESVKPGDALAVAERVTAVLNAPFIIDGKELSIGASIGITVTMSGKEKSDDLLRNADVAMYAAKKQGKGRCIIFENKMHTALMDRIGIENDMRRAVEKEEFTLCYQPIVELESGKMTGMEALARWEHPTRGQISPVEFIPVAEETGLILPLGRWILETACRQARTWQIRHGYSEDPFYVTVNLSARQFQHAELVEMVKIALHKSDLPPECLVLEITESMMLQDTETTIRKLKELKKLGLQLAIDDFGTGYSALSYLQRFPVDIIKIDKSFVDKISHGREGAAVARAIITMSDTLHLKTVAEGIEEVAQKTVLRDLGCSLGQGYHFARPLNVEAMSRFLESGNSGTQTSPPGFASRRVIEMPIHNTL